MLTYCICDLEEGNPISMRGLGATAVFLGYVKLFYYLRIFDKIGHMVRIVIKVIEDMLYFAIIFLIGILAFGNTFYILSLNGIDYSSCDDKIGMTEDCSPFSGSTFLLALIYSF